MIYFWILLNLAVITNAIMRASCKANKTGLSHVFELLMIVCFAGMIIISQELSFKVTTWPENLYLVLMYILIRIGLFNVVWSLFRFKMTYYNIHLFKRKNEESYRVNFKLPRLYWWYIGDGLYDRILTWIMTDSWFGKAFKPPMQFFLGWLYVISWAMSIGVLTNGFYITF
jgi:hypothetical protein